MTTDITELAQRVERIISDMRLKHGDKDTYAPVMKWDEFLALVEALEARDKQIANDVQIKARLCRESNSLHDRLREAEKRIAELESRTVTDWIEHDGKWRPESLGLDELVYLKTRKQELKIPYPAGKVKGWMNTGGDMDVMAYKLASPQASTVTVKPMRPGHITVGGEKLGIYMRDEVDEFLAALTAAGIKWEAE
ncbi:hypothetical protein [Klebsiella grimontii]|uniref:hypothetical protein n=1 Tax=Klebsiella grimontii TaxID=2058152 RepID=UPI0023689B9F|nr:hypothetical protein [Klebsiella grimontii]WDI72471.1 hypothetical protein PU992_12715 [Klebsiella grimontii]